jgi:protoporphyrinogen/coproporphyrinogen III oxidase
VTASPLTVVVGAGISGLSCAHALKRSGQNVLVLEASDKPGGMIQSVEENNFLFELGPQSFSGTESIFRLCDELGISDQLMEAPRRAPRFILIDGQLLPVPLSPISFLTSSLLSSRTKFSVLTEAFRTSPPPKADESVANFVRAKFTPELLDRLVGPFVSGIFAGDPEQLSLRAAFPKIYEAEKLSGSVVRGSLRLARTRPKPTAGRRTGLYSFRKGNATLVHALAESLGDSLQCGTKVVAPVERKESRFRLKVGSGGKVDELHAGKLVFSTPTWANFDLLLEIVPDAGFPFRDIEYAHVTVVSHGYHGNQIGADLSGFGFLIPRSQKIETLGTVWNSSLFPERAPANHVLLTSFIGGAINRNSLLNSPEEAAAVVRSDLAKILRISGVPVVERVTAYHAAIPQYNLGHTLQLDRIRESVAKVPGLWLTGNYWNGPSIGACVEHAQLVAESIRIG